MKNKNPLVYGIGQCCLDYLGYIPRLPNPDEKCEFTDLTVEGGGVVATALCALARWGVHCSISGIAGDDAFGPMIRASLEDEGIDTGGLITRSVSQSQFAFIAADPGMETRTIFWQRPTGKPLTPDELDYDLIRRATVLHTDVLFPEATIAACKAAKKAGAYIVVDAGSLREGMLDVARLSDCFIASRAFARTLVGEDDPAGACKKLAELGPPLVGVTLGAQGYVVLDRGRVITRPAYRVAAKDTTGCGDIFHAGYIYGHLHTWRVEKSLAFAAWAAAMVSRRLGGRKGIPAVDSWGHVDNT